MAVLQTERRNISFSIFVVLAVLAICLALVWPLMVQGQLRSKISKLEDTLSTQGAIIASKDTFDQQYASLNQQSSVHGRLLHGTSQPQAEIDAQSRIRSILERRNVKLLQTQSKSAVTEDGFVEIVTSVQLECKHSQLNDILYDLEFGETQFSIDRMDIRRQRVRSTAPANNTKQANQVTQLRVTLDIKGFWSANTTDQ
jgi:hypothetical protein